MSFPPGFVWGAATSAYQIEGAAYDDGKGPSVWDVFCRRPGAIWHGHRGDVACDHYHRYREDLLLLKELGLRAYRFSVSWPRVLSRGVGAANQAGLAFYERLVDGLLAAGIEPYLTLFHWDFPYALYCQGGWLNRDVADWFAEYAALVARTLGDRVRYWMTINEPQVVAVLGHQDGIHAPGDRLQVSQVLQIAHHLLLAHGRAVQALRATLGSGAQIGIVSTGPIAEPAGADAADVEAARQATFAMRQPTLWSHAWWLDPVFFQRYPDDGLQLFGSESPEMAEGDVALIAQPLDFLAVNIYNGVRVRSEDGEPRPEPWPVGGAQAANDWPVTPDVLYWGPRFLWERYRLPIIVAENGMANLDWISADGHVHDPQRIDYTRRYLLALERVCSDGVPVVGYFHWSVFDNFEWAEGMRYRFGLIFVDYATQRRVLKDSALWYREVIRSNGRSLVESDRSAGRS